jgi:Flp pilus assembly pilin Flp
VNGQGPELKKWPLLRRQTIMRSLVRRLWREEDGMVQAASHLLLVVIIAVGGIIGLSTFRIAVVQSLGDVAQSLLSLNQSYSITVGTVSSSYTDITATSLPPQTPGNEPYGIDVHDIQATPESGS